MRNRLIVAAALIGVTVSAAVFAQQKGGITPLTALDYAEIQQLYVRYCGNYFLMMAPPEPNTPPAIAATGVYVDVLVKTREGWRFRQRTFTSGLPSSPI